MTKEHVIGDLYLKLSELGRAHQSLLVENEKLKGEMKMMESLLSTQNNNLPKINIDNNVLKKDSDNERKD